MSQINISLKQLRYFLVAAGSESFRQAARELRITQPSLSSQIKILEEVLDVSLFERSRGGISLTPIGREMIPDVREAVQAAQSIIKAAEISSKGPTGTFRLGVSPSLGPYSLPWILPVLHSTYRDIKFYVREEVPGVLSKGLETGEHELIFSTLPIDSERFVTYPLFREPIYLVTSAEHPLAGRSKINAAELENLEVLTVKEEQNLFHKQVEDLCKRFNATLLRDFEGTSLDAIRQMVYMEMGVAFLPALYIRSEIRDRSDLCIMEIKNEPIYRIHALAWRSTSPLRSFYVELAEVFKRAIDKSFGKDVKII